MSEQLVRQRAAFRAVVTKEYNGLQNFMQGASLTQLKAELAYIHGIAEKLVNFNTEILTLCTEEEEVNNEIERACEYDKKCLLIINELEASICVNSPPTTKAKKKPQRLKLTETNFT